MKEKNNFYDRCYKVICCVPKGRVTTYKEIAHALNSKAYRAVGTAMKTNPNAPQVPCHRVVNSDGRIGKYAYGSPKKVKLLKNEGIQISNNKVSELKNYLITAKELKMLSK